MNPKVSFILPARNLERVLRDRVQVILDLLAELTPQFEVLIVDYGSRDETREIAMDLVREYPQVDFLDKPDAPDLLAAVEAGIFRTCGEIIFIDDPSVSLMGGAVQSLWKLRDDQDLVMAQSRAQTLAGRATAAATAGGTLQMIRRCAMPAVRRPAEAAFAVDRVTRTDLIAEPAESARLPKLLARLRRVGRVNL